MGPGGGELIRYHNLIPPVIWVVVMAFAYRAILAGKLGSLFGAKV